MRPPTPPRSGGPDWSRKRIIIPAAVVLLFLGVGIGASGGSSDTKTAADSKAAPTMTTTATATVTAKPAAKAANQAKPAPTLTITKTVTSKPKPPAAADKGDRVTVPNFVGQGLQAAQDAAQAKGFYLLKSHDSTGGGRLQVFDRNWKVCTQNRAAGKTVPADTELDFGTVKLEESCP